MLCPCSSETFWLNSCEVVSISCGSVSIRSLWWLSIHSWLIPIHSCSDETVAKNDGEIACMVLASHAAEGRGGWLEPARCSAKTSEVVTSRRNVSAWTRAHPQKGVWLCNGLAVGCLPSRLDGGQQRSKQEGLRTNTQGRQARRRSYASTCERASVQLCMINLRNIGLGMADLRGERGGRGRRCSAHTQAECLAVYGLPPLHEEG